jgi:hypothetical protein
VDQLSGKVTRVKQTSARPNCGWVVIVLVGMAFLSLSRTSAPAPTPAATVDGDYGVFGEGHGFGGMTRGAHARFAREDFLGKYNYQSYLKYNFRDAC